MSVGLLQAQGIDADMPPSKPGAQAGADRAVQPAAPPGLIPLTVSQRAKQTLGSGMLWRSNLSCGSSTLHTRLTGVPPIAALHDALNTHKHGEVLV
jgi:hypothetical protein